MGTTVQFNILLIVLFLKIMVTDTGQVGVTGHRQKCSNEGEPVFMERHKWNECFSCICKNGFVECEPYCQPTEGCYFLIGRKESDCCNRCKGCMYRGRYYDSHTEWTDPEDPCKILHCEAGVVTESDIQCYNNCPRPLKPKAGRCCGTCLGCRLNGIIISNDRDVTIPEDPCVKCNCEDGRTTCIKKACPVLHCSGDGKLYKAPGECCPKCIGTRSLMPIKKKCVVGSRTYNTEERFNLDKCTQCSCTNETAVCRRVTCPVLKCDVKQQKMRSDDCCPYCENSEIMEFQSTCSVGGKVYQDGESWPLDSCKSCMCSQGQIRCAVQRCLPIGENDCPPNTRLETPVGQCCAKCIENDGVCTVFGDPHYKTFDGKFFSFQGSCKYLLTSDCVNKTFSVRVTNEARNTRYSAWTRTVAIKAGRLKINLGQKLRIKINGTKIEPPYSMPGVIDVEKQNNSIKVKTNIGIMVIWNGRGFLEVYASTKYKGKLCGLCGNFNSIAQDDMTMKNNRVINDNEVWKFANSWKVGGKKACGRLVEQNKKPFCKEKKNKNCRALKYGVQFGECNTKLSPSNYYEACLQDMCECPNDNCYCESFFAYARECERLNVNLPDWRKETRCTGERNRKNQKRKSSNRRKGFDLLNAPRNISEFIRSHKPTKLPIK